MENKLDLSVVVPLYNEEGNVRELHSRILAACQALTPILSSPRFGEAGQRERGINSVSFEIIFIDDGSEDKTVEICRDLRPLKLIQFRKNFGQTAAFDTGIKEARGDVIITLDGDLQNDPADIPLLLAELEKGADVVSGWRFQRKDTLMKRFFSRGANLLRKFFVADKIHDSGCSLKAYRRECFRNVDLFGEMHRFIPAVLELQGYKISEVKVSHHPRVHGKTKYNWKRAVKGLVDMIEIWFWRKYSSRPLHLFGGAGILIFMAGMGILTWMAVEKIFFDISLSEKIWPLIGAFLLMIGVQIFIFGLLAGILMKNYYRGKGEMNYSIKEIIEN